MDGQSNQVSGNNFIDDNHDELLTDLDTLISEISKESKVDHIGGYLKYWLLNHVQTFDIPAFKTKF